MKLNATLTVTSARYSQTMDGDAISMESLSPIMRQATPSSTLTLEACEQQESFQPLDVKSPGETRSHETFQKEVHEGMYVMLCNIGIQI